MSSRLPPKNADYRTQEYWEERYQKEDEGVMYDWFKKYEDISEPLAGHISREDKILHLGCGNSTLGADMYADGFHNIVNVDFSQTCINSMAEKYKDMDKMKWSVMDMRALDAEDGSYDIVLDKGTLDAIWTDESAGVAEDVGKTCAEVSRVLKKDGKWVMLSMGQPHLRRKYLVKPEYDWALDIETIGESGFLQYFLYILTKGKVEESDEQNADDGVETVNPYGERSDSPTGEMLSMGGDSGFHLFPDAEEY